MLYLIIKRHACRGKAIYRILVVMLAFVLAGCQWVKATDESSNVSLKDDVKGVIDCQLLGTASSYVKTKIGIFSRGKAKVAEELALLAKNEAAKMGGDTIVAASDVEDSRQSFDVYRCH